MLSEFNAFWRTRRWARRLGWLLLIILGWHTVGYLHLAWLRTTVSPADCYNLVSPDERYTLRHCILKLAPLIGLIPSVDIGNMQIFDNADGRLVYETVLYEPFAASIPTVWTNCDKMPEARRTPGWKPGQVCHVRWAYNGGAGERPEYEFATDLPPSRWMQFRAKLP